MEWKSGKKKKNKKKEAFFFFILLQCPYFKMPESLCRSKQVFMCTTEFTDSEAFKGKIHPENMHMNIIIMAFK